MAIFNRRANHLPTSARLTTDSALCPNPRVSVMAMHRAVAPAARLIPSTVNPSASAIPVNTTRAPKRSVKRPQGRQNIAPTSVAHRLMVAYSTRSICRSRSSGSVINPSPCVRPGSVPTMANAATPKFAHP